MNGNGHLLRPINLDTRNSGILPLVHDEASNEDVITEHLPVFLSSSKPHTRPLRRNAESEAVGVYFLSHRGEEELFAARIVAESTKGIGITDILSPGTRIIILSIPFRWIPRSLCNGACNNFRFERLLLRRFLLLHFLLLLTCGNNHAKFDSDVTRKLINRPRSTTCHGNGALICRPSVNNKLFDIEIFPLLPVVLLGIRHGGIHYFIENESAFFWQLLEI